MVIATRPELETAVETRRGLGPDQLGASTIEQPRSPRRDALPEHTNYMDTGCDLHPNCLTCPLVRCRYDQPGGARKLLSNERDSAIIALQHSQRLPVNDIAHRYGISRRTVFRVLARARGEA